MELCTKDIVALARENYDDIADVMDRIVVGAEAMHARINEEYDAYPVRIGRFDKSGLVLPQELEW